MQQQPQMMPMMSSSFPSTNITTEQIQKYLDENKKLIMAILDNQNLGKLAECAQYQALLQKNLMYLAAIADAQPPPPTIPHQMSPHPVMQQGGAYFMQHPQAQAAMAQQSGIFPQKVPMQFGNPHPNPMQDPQMHPQHHVFQGQMGARPGGAINGMHTMHPETAHGGGGGGSSIGPLSSDVRGGGRQDVPETGPNDGAPGHGGGGGDGESYLKGSEEGK